MFVSPNDLDAGVRFASLSVVDELLILAEVALDPRNPCVFTALGDAVSAIRYETVGQPPSMRYEVNWILGTLRTLPLRRVGSNPLICGCCYSDRGHTIHRPDYALAYLRNRAGEQLH